MFPPCSPEFAVRLSPRMSGLSVRCSLLFALVSFIVCAPLTASAPPDNETASDSSSLHAVSDVSSLAEELGRISSALEKKASREELAVLRNSLPAQWTITTDEQNYSISTEFLRGQLSDGSSEKAKLWADNLADKLRSYSAPGQPVLAASRAELDRILAESEFASVRPPSAWDLLRLRISAWLARLFARLFGGLMRYPIGGTILFWVVVIACVGFIGMWVFRFMIGRDRMNAMASRQIETASRTWQEWIRAAREAALRSDFREAVHCAYWAGIARLEDCGALPKDHTKTPREYLALLSEPATLLAGAEPCSASDRYTLSTSAKVPRPSYREPLSVLTRRFEYIWYANRGASHDDFRDALQQLEALGCQLE
jgi:Domain of unknown function (DUF4129)